MGQLLNFNPHRGLGFDPSDGVDFDIDRDRFFDADRALTFDSDRDLGFGKRGPVFRGFVCPVCGAAATETQPSCTECGATFADSPGGEVSRPSRKPIKKAPKVKAERRSDRRREAPAAAPAAAPADPSASSAGACSRCGARVLTTDAFCWNCGARFSRAESVPLGSPHKTQSVTKDWQETGKDLKDYLEK